MIKLTKHDRIRIENIRERKQRTLEKILSILEDVCKDNKEIFKKKPEGRLKSLESIINKTKALPRCTINKLERYIKDIAGARVVCCTIDEIQKATELIKNHPDIIDCKVVKNFEDGADEFGYRGHHLLITVKIYYGNKTIRDICEVQIRTLAQDLWAVLSHRDFYKTPSNPPQLVLQDMVTLNKLLEVVDQSAVSLRQKIRVETDREIREKSKRLTQKDMLTPDNIQKLISNKFHRDISIDFAYQLIQFALSNDVSSLKDYKNAITNNKYQNTIKNIFNEFEMEPELGDKLYGAVILKSEGLRKGSNTLRGFAKDFQKERQKKLKAVEKGRTIAKEELRKQTKISKPAKRKKKNMKVLLVTYDLKNPNKDYTGIYEALKKSAGWWHYLESCWLLKTDLSPQEWFNKLKPHIDDNDTVLIIEVTRNYQGWLPKKAWDWINNNIGV